MSEEKLPHARRIVVRGAQLAIGLLMGWAALAKLVDLPAFAHEVHNFQILPVPLENLVAMVLPWIELVAALSLVLRVRPRAGAVVTTGLMAVFTVAVAAALVRGLNIECGCFGTSSASRVGVAKLVQNLVMLAVSGVATGAPGEVRAGRTARSSQARTLSPEL